MLTTIFQKKIINENGGNFDVPTYINVAKDSQTILGSSKTELLRISKDSIVENYLYRVFVNMKYIRSGGGANTRSQVELSLEQGSNIAVIGKIDIWNDDGVFLNIPQISKRYSFNKLDDIVVYGRNITSGITVDVYLASVTIE